VGENTTQVQDETCGKVISNHENVPTFPTGSWKKEKAEESSRNRREKEGVL
jgi:hypothetical protein